jgi:hypothetical protein
LDASAIEENDSKEKKAVCWFREMGDGLHGMLSSLGNIEDGVSLLRRFLWPLTRQMLCSDTLFSTFKK